MIKLLFSTVLFVFYSTPALAGYSYVRSITINASQVNNNTGSLAQFPILVCGNASSGACTAAVSGMATITHGGHIQSLTTVNSQSVPADLIFTTDSACSNKLTWEVENYNTTTGEFEAWVTNTSTPLSGTSNTTFYMCYGNSAITTYQSTASSVWDSNFVGVWHFGGNGTLSLADSTSNANNGTNSGVTATDSQTGGGAAFSGSNTISVTSSASLQFSGSFSVSMWIKTTSLNSSAQSSFIGNEAWPNTGWIVFDNGQYSSTVDLVYQPGAGGGCGQQFTCVARASVNNGNWHNLYAVYKSGVNALFYLDGSLADSELPGSFINNTNNIIMGDSGNSPFTGALGEVKISNTFRTAGWIATEYNNQSAPSSFYTMGSENPTNPPGSIPGLVGWWPFEEGGGTTTADLSGNGNGGTLTGSPSWITGKIGGALSFNGSNQEVAFGNVLPFVNGDSITITFWATESTDSNYHKAVSRELGSGSTNRNYEVGFNNNQTLAFIVVSGATFNIWSSSSTYTDANWHAYAVTFTFGTGTSLQFYRDGKLIAGSWTSSNGNSAPATGDAEAFYIGGNGQGEWWPGEIDDVRIYKRILSAGEVYEIFEQGGQSHMGVEF